MKHEGGQTARKCRKESKKQHIGLLKRLRGPQRYAYYRLQHWKRYLKFIFLQYSVTKQISAGHAIFAFCVTSVVTSRSHFRAHKVANHWFWRTAFLLVQRQKAFYINTDLGVVDRSFSCIDMLKNVSSRNEFFSFYSCLYKIKCQFTEAGVLQQRFQWQISIFQRE